MALAPLDGRTALLTGALGTLGRAQSVALVAAGARLLLLDRPELARDGAEFAATLDGDARYVGQDLADLAGAEGAVRALADERRVDVLINNAALIINKPFEDFSLDEYEEQVRVNSSAAFALTRGVAPAMKAAGYGKIVNFCSITLNGNWDGYGPLRRPPRVRSSGSPRRLARELGPFGVRVNAISPGAIVSDAEARVFGDRLESFNAWVLERQSLKHRLQPADVRRRRRLPGITGVRRDQRPEHRGQRWLVRVPAGRSGSPTATPG